MSQKLVDIRNLVVEYPAKGFRKKPFRALKGVSIDIEAGETVGLVGESGSGKTTLGRALLGLAPVTGGSITYDGREIARLPTRDRRALGHEIQVVFQDPYTSLNPRKTVGDIIGEPFEIHPDAGEPVDPYALLLGLCVDEMALPKPKKG